MYILIVFLYTTLEWFCVWASEKHDMETNMSIVQKFLSCEYLEFYFLIWSESTAADWHFTSFAAHPPE